LHESANELTSHSFVVGFCFVSVLFWWLFFCFVSVVVDDVHFSHQG